MNVNRLLGKYKWDAKRKSRDCAGDAWDLPRAGARFCNTLRDAAAGMDLVNDT